MNRRQEVEIQCERGVIGSRSPVVDRERMAKQWFGRVVLCLCKIHGSQIAFDPRRHDMVRSERLSVEFERTQVGSCCLREPTLGPVKSREVILADRQSAIPRAES